MQRRPEIVPRNRPTPADDDLPRDGPYAQCGPARMFRVVCEIRGKRSFTVHRGLTRDEARARATRLNREAGPKDKFYYVVPSTG